MREGKMKCQRCGWCCRNIVINVSYSDIMRWTEERRFDILREVSWINNYPKENTGGFYIAKTSFNPKQPCPFLFQESGMSSCNIHNTKPKACRDAPASYDNRDQISGCEGYAKSNIYIRKLIKKDQYRDFKKAFDNKGSLMAVLVSARRG